MSFKTWDSGFEASPPHTEVPTLGDDRIRELKAAIRERAELEHRWSLEEDSSTHGWHRPGSSMVYYQSEPPTLLPDGDTPLGDNAYSRGRIWIDTDTNIPYAWNGTGFTALFYSVGESRYSFLAPTEIKPSSGTTAFVFVDATDCDTDTDARVLFRVNDGTEDYDGVIGLYGSTGALRFRTGNTVLSGGADDSFVILPSGGVQVNGTITASGIITSNEGVMIDGTYVENPASGAWLKMTKDGYPSVWFGAGNSTTAHYWTSAGTIIFGVNEASELSLTSSVLGPYADGGLSLGSSSDRFLNIYYSSTLYGQNIDCSSNIKGGTFSSNYFDANASGIYVGKAAGASVSIFSIYFESSDNPGSLRYNTANGRLEWIGEFFVTQDSRFLGETTFSYAIFVDAADIGIGPSGIYSTDGPVNVIGGLDVTGNIIANGSVIVDSSLMVEGTVVLDDLLSHNESGGYVGYSTSNGRLGRYTSARSTKYDIVYGPDTSWIYDLNLASYSYKGSKDLRYGFIADDLIETVPELVTYNKDGSVSAYDFFSVFSAGINELQKLKDELRIAGILN